MSRRYSARHSPKPLPPPFTAAGSWPCSVRASGKTTLARQFVPPESPNYFDLEDPVSMMRLAEQMTALRDLAGIIVIDEVQRLPDIFPIRLAGGARRCNRKAAWEE